MNTTNSQELNFFSRAGRSGSALFAKACLSANLGSKSFDFLQLWTRTSPFGFLFPG